jgi:hypothetical protein
MNTNVSEALTASIFRGDKSTKPWHLFIKEHVTPQQKVTLMLFLEDGTDSTVLSAARLYIKVFKSYSL